MPVIEFFNHDARFVHAVVVRTASNSHDQRSLHSNSRDRTPFTCLRFTYGVTAPSAGKMKQSRYVNGHRATPSVTDVGPYFVTTVSRLFPLLSVLALDKTQMAVESSTLLLYILVPTSISKVASSLSLLCLFKHFNIICLTQH